MDIKHYRDDGRNYMVIKVEGTKDFDYQQQMLFRNRISGLIPCRSREIDGDRYLYYETTGHVSIVDYFGRKKLGAEEIERLFRDAKEVLDTLKEYLLNTDGLLWNPGCIYAGIRDGRYRFCFHASLCQDDGIQEFCDWLHRTTDPEDRKAVQLITRMREGASGTKLSLSQLLEDLLMEEEETVSSEVPQYASMSCASETDRCLQESDFLTESSWLSSGRLGEPVYEEDWCGSEVLTDDTPRMAEYGSTLDEVGQEGWRQHMGLLLPGGLFLVTFLVVSFLRLRFQLTMTEQVITVAVSIVSAIVTTVCAYLLFRAKGKKGSKVRGLPQEATCNYRDLPGCQEEQAFRSHDALRARFLEEEGILPKAQSQFRSDYGNQEREYETETVLLQGQTGRKPRLYSRGDGRLIRIDLEKLPLTVGKLPGVADFLLKREEISRLHVRFFQKDGKDTIFMKDLNSTNGTFRNGLRLTAGEAVAIYPGDEVRLGSLEFEFV